MRPQYTIYTTADPLLLRESSSLRSHWEEGYRIIWNYDGLLGVIPPATLSAAFTILDDYRRRLRPLDRIPADVGTVHFEETVRLNAVSAHGLDRNHRDI